MSPGGWIVIGWVGFSAWWIVYYGFDVDHRIARWRQRRDDRRSRAHLEAVEGRCEPTTSTIDFEGWLKLEAPPRRSAR